MSEFAYDAESGFVHLTTLRQSAWPKEYIELRAIDATGVKDRFWLNEPGQEVEKVNDWLQQRYNVYAGVATRQKGGGKAEYLISTSFIWAEVDFKLLEGREDQARQIIERYPLLPRMVISSGGGLHLYFPIGRTQLTEPEERDDLKSRLTQLICDLQADPQCKDTTRILRLAGTWNFKPDYPKPRAVSFFDGFETTTDTYRLHDFPTVAKSAPQPIPPRPPRTAESGKVTPDELLHRALDQAPAGRHKGGLWLACQMRDNLFSQAEAENVLREYQARTPAGDHAYTLTEAVKSVEGAYSRAPREPWAEKGVELQGNRSVATRMAKKYEPPKEKSDPQGDIAPEVTPVTEEIPIPNSSPAESNQDLELAFVHLTDMGNAVRMVERHGCDLRFSKGWGWLAWDGARWQPDDTGETMRRAKHTALMIYKEMTAIANLKISQATSGPISLTAPKEGKHSHQVEPEDLAKHAKRSQGRDRLAAMISLAESEPTIPVRITDWDARPMMFGCLNGTLDLQTGSLRPARREDLLTKRANVTFDKEARCPLWVKFLERVLPDPEVRLFFQQACGYSLTGDVSEHALFFLHGSGRNGKSTALNTLLAVLGDYAMEATSDLLIQKQGEEHPTKLADLQGRRFVATVEVDDGRKLAEGLVKSLTGGEHIRARRMREDFFQFPPTHKIFLAANHKPIVRGMDFAIWSRIKLIPFTVRIGPEEKDKHLTEKLIAESSGILNWLIDGCQMWRRDGLSEPAAVVEAVEGYKTEMDVLAPFFEDRCTLGDGPDIWATKSSLWAAYEKWALANGGLVFKSERELGRQIRSREGITEAKTTKTEQDPWTERNLVKGTRIWRGIRIHSQDENDDESGESGQSGAKGGAVALGGADSDMSDSKKVSTRGNAENRATERHPSNSATFPDDQKHETRSTRAHFDEDPEQEEGD